jgi:hypothetical protein
LARFGRRGSVRPGEQLHDTRLSFWQDGHEFDSRPTVLSLTVDRGRFSGFARWRRKTCVETPNPNGSCRGGNDECRCALQEGLDGGARIDICDCRES